jgi:hypothetical protein
VGEEVLEGDVLPEEPGRLDEADDERVLEGGGALERAGDDLEEPGGLPTEEGLEGDVLAAREGPVEGGAGHAGAAGDVVRRGLGDPPAADALEHGVDDPVLERLRGRAPWRRPICDRGGCHRLRQ